MAPIILDNLSRKDTASRFLKMMGKWYFQTAFYKAYK
jgi:hypothetical protein